MRKNLASLSLVVTAAFFGGATHSQADVFLSNLGNTNTGFNSAGAFGTPYLAAGFQTGNSGGPGFTLNSISYAFSGGGNPTGPLTISLYNTNSGNPGSALVSLTGVNPTTAGTYSLTPASAIVLNDSSIYWVVFRYEGSGTYDFPLSNSSSASPQAPGWSTVAYVGSDNGTSWYPPSGEYLKISVDAIPEPSTTVLLGAAGLGFLVLRRRYASAK